MIVERFTQFDDKPTFAKVDCWPTATWNGTSRANSIALT